MRNLFDIKQNRSSMETPFMSGSDRFTADFLMDAQRFPRTDREDALVARQNQLDAAQYALDQVGVLLHQADTTLAEIDRNSMLGTAIVRGCRDLADGIGGVALHLEQQTLEERRALAQACIQDAQASLLLMEESAGGAVDDWERRRSSLSASGSSSCSSEELASLPEEEIMGAIQAAASLLRDVEATLRAIDREEAEEIADVALTVARIFVASLQSIHASLTPHQLIQGGASSEAIRSGPYIERLDSDDENEVVGRVAQPVPESVSASTYANAARRDRLRVLWPPLGPAVSSTLKWGQEAATQKPLLAVALGLTLWPWAVVGAFVATPLVLVDGFLQSAYDNFQNGPIIHGIERTAAQVYQTGRLSFLCGKLMVRQTYRVAARQVHRYGGVGQIARHVGEFTLERIVHPIETAGFVWDGLAWGVNAISGILVNHEQDETVQRLQQ